MSCFFSIIAYILILLSCDANASGLGPDCEVPNASLLKRQTQDFCSFQCELNEKAKQNTPVSPACAERTKQLIDKDIGTSPGIKMISCLKALGEGFLSNLGNDELKNLVDVCKTQVECRRDLARQLEQFRHKDSSGKYLIDDATVDRQTLGSTTATVPQVMDLVERSKRNQAATRDLCINELTKITKSLGAEFSAADDESAQRKVREKRLALLKGYDPACPEIVKLNSADPQKPNLPKALEDIRKVARSSVDEYASIPDKVSRWYSELDVAYQCYGAEARRDLACYGLARALLKPSNIAGAAALAAKVANLTKVESPAALRKRRELTPRELEIARAPKITEEMRPTKVIPEDVKPPKDTAFEIRSRGFAPRTKQEMEEFIKSGEFKDGIYNYLIVREESGIDRPWITPRIGSAEETKQGLWASHRSLAQKYREKFGKDPVVVDAGEMLVNASGEQVEVLNSSGGWKKGNLSTEYGSHVIDRYGLKKTPRTRVEVIKPGADPEFGHLKAKEFVDRYRAIDAQHPGFIAEVNRTYRNFTARFPELRTANLPRPDGSMDYTFSRRLSKFVNVKREPEKAQAYRDIKNILNMENYSSLVASDTQLTQMAKEGIRIPVETRVRNMQRYMREFVDEFSRFDK